MKGLWYADNRDLVKWGVLLTLANRYSVRQILQVLYYRPTNWAHIEIDGEKVAIPEAVIQHFRCTGAISTIKGPCPVDVVSETFADRDEYQRIVVDRIRSRTEAPGIVFLDPDNGLEPGSPSLKHVLNSELGDIWNELKSGDLLVFYQHQTNRNGQPWIDAKRDLNERWASRPVRLGSLRLMRLHGTSCSSSLRRPANLGLQPAAAGAILSRRG